MKKERRGMKMSTAEIETRFPRELAVGKRQAGSTKKGAYGRRRRPSRRTTRQRRPRKHGRLSIKGRWKVTASVKAAEEGKTTAEAQEALHWKGGEGNYGMVRKKEERVCFQPVGGMRDPHLAVRRYPTVQALGKRDVGLLGGVCQE